MHQAVLKRSWSRIPPARLLETRDARSVIPYSIKPVCYIDTPRAGLGAATHTVISLNMTILNRNYLILYIIVLREKSLAVTASGYFFYFFQFSDAAILCKVFRYCPSVCLAVGRCLDPAGALTACHHRFETGFSLRKLLTIQ